MAQLQKAVAIAAPFTAGFEGFRASPYFDVNGYAIGYGNHYYSDGTAVEQTDDPISQPDAWDLMNFYLSQAAAVINGAITVSLSNNQLAALSDVHYNQGSLGSALLNLINGGADTATVAASLAGTGTAARGAARAALYSQGLFASPTLAVIGVTAGILIAVGVFSK